MVFLHLRLRDLSHSLFCKLQPSRKTVMWISRVAKESRNSGVTFKIRSALKMKLHDLEFDLGRALQNGRMQRHLGCWQGGAGSPLFHMDSLLQQNWQHH